MQLQRTEQQIDLPPVALDAGVEVIAAKARESFFAFRVRMRPSMKQNWWTALVAQALQEFYEDLLGGKRPALVIEAPPQHGKSWAATDFLAWVAGKNPDFKSIFASYSDDLGMRTNLDLQRMMKSPRYQEIFSKLQSRVMRVPYPAGQSACGREHCEVCDVKRET
jgi:hypothetical protein